MDLSYNAPRENLQDPLYPGENWFYYWKSSASMWKHKLEQLTSSGPLCIPLYWAFHSENGEHYDFGQTKPEANLKRLWEALEDTHKQAVLLFPLTPLPFLPNGGMPTTLAKNLALDASGLTYSFADHEERAHRFYSFFDPKAYMSYKKLIDSLARYLQKENIEIPVVGLIGGQLGGGMFQTYLNDSSQTFAQGLGRFLEIKNLGLKEEAKKTKGPESSREWFKEEWNVQCEYNQQMHALYLSSAQEGLQDAWKGTLEVCFLDGRPQDILRRAWDSVDLGKDYFQLLQDMLSMNVIPSSVLIPAKTKQGILEKALLELIPNTIGATALNLDFYEDDFKTQYRPLVLFELFLSSSIPQQLSGRASWQEMGLVSALNFAYPSTWRYLKGKMNLSTLPQGEHSYVILQGSDLEELGTIKVLRHFMSGGRILLDSSSLSEADHRRIELFILENSLPREKVNYGITLTYTHLGPGRLILFHGSELTSKPQKVQEGFWNQLLKALEIPHLQVEAEKEVYTFWRSRSPRPTELDFQEIRRLGLYNPTSYKRKVKVTTAKNFAFTKSVDEVNSKVRNTNSLIDIELGPMGSVSLDFGLFEI